MLLHNRDTKQVMQIVCCSLCPFAFCLGFYLIHHTYQHLASHLHEHQRGYHCKKAADSADSTGPGSIQGGSNDIDGRLKFGHQFRVMAAIILYLRENPERDLDFLSYLLDFGQREFPDSNRLKIFAMQIDTYVRQDLDNLRYHKLTGWLPLDQRWLLYCPLLYPCRV